MHTVKNMDEEGGRADAFRKRFRLPALLVVVHVQDEDQTEKNVQTAKRAGADGVWLIAHGTSVCTSQLDLLASCFRRVRAKFPDFFIGVNVLDLMHRPFELFGWVTKNLESCDGVWTDNCHAERPHVMRRIDEERRRFPGLYFGGVAFKHQDKVHPKQDEAEMPLDCKKALSEAAAAARPFVDLVTTSGTRTGAMPSLEKVKAIAKGARPGLVAISGAGMEMHSYAAHCDVFFAATAISKTCSVHNKPDSCDESFCWLDPHKVAAWVKIRTDGFEQPVEK